MDIETGQNRDENSLYPLLSHDRLKVLSSTRSVVTQSRHVHINHERLGELAQKWLQERAGADDHPNGQEQWYFQYHFFDGSERTVNWMLLLDALNFCFWSEPGQPRWTIAYKGEILNGYWAEAAALTRAVEEGLPLWDASYLSELKSETLAYIFRGEQTIPLFEERLHNAREVGTVLQTHFHGQFSQVITQAQGSAPALAELLITYFPSFNDITTYRGQEVRFLKRAQICVSDLASAFKGTMWGAFSDLDQLTAFADYKLPQVLRHFRVFEYSDALARRIDSQELLPAGSEEEVEIRAATVWACELLQRIMRQGGQEHVTAAEIDQRLWLLGQDATAMHPYHRTRTIFY